MVNAENLARFLVDELFKLGEETEKVRRIQFMLGDYHNEKAGCGMGRESLIKFFASKLETLNP
jgi:hypothetical protein